MRGLIRGIAESSLACALSVLNLSVALPGSRNVPKKSKMCVTARPCGKHPSKTKPALQAMEVSPRFQRPRSTRSTFTKVCRFSHGPVVKCIQHIQRWGLKMEVRTRIQMEGKAHVPSKDPTSGPKIYRMALQGKEANLAFIRPMGPHKARQPTNHAWSTRRPQRPCKKSPARVVLTGAECPKNPFTTPPIFVKPKQRKVELAQVSKGGACV